MTTQTRPAVNQQSAVATRPAQTIKSLLNGPEFMDQVKRALPSHLKPDRFIRIALTATMRTPKLLKCDHASFFNALLTLSQLGIEPDGRRAHLIPFENRKRNVTECQLIIDYKGLAELAMRSGVVSNIHADVVCENDEFEYDRGELKRHKINFRSPRGKIYAVYALCRFKDGTEKSDVMDLEEIEGIRKRSRAGDNGPWVTDWSEMAKKTVFRRLSKWLPLSAEFRDAVEADSDELPPIENTPARSPESLVSVVQNFEPETVDAVPEDDVPMDDHPALGATEAPKSDPPKQPETPQAELCQLVQDAGGTFDTFQKWCVQGGTYEGCDAFSRFSELPTVECVRLLKAKNAISKAMKGAA